MTVSVCMVVKDAERFIGEQLASVYFQTRQADEVCIFDDRSSDKTVSLINDFIAKFKLEKTWTLHVNAIPLGRTVTTFHAMGACSQDIVFLCGQDDMWDPTKIETIMNVFEKEEDIRLLSSKYGRMSESGRPVVESLSEIRASGKETSKIKKVNLYKVLSQPVPESLSLAYRRRWFFDKLRLVSDVPAEFLLSVMAAEEEAFYSIDEMLGWRRKYSPKVNEETGKKEKINTKSKRLEYLEKYIAILQALKSEKVPIKAESIPLIDERQTAYEKQALVLKSDKGIELFRIYFGDKNIKFSEIMKDLIVIGDRN